MSTITACQTARHSLESLAGPKDVRRLAAGQLPQVAAAIRAFLIEKVTAAGGHLGPNLGVVELTLALHRVFDVEAGDAVLFDTGHQAYVHKLLTGRRQDFGQLRQPGGLSGYPCRAESRHDWIENSHASTALSYAHGLATARRLAVDRSAVVAVVGDGVLTGGMAFEALNNLGGGPCPVIVVLNDNGRSYAPAVGALAAHLAVLRGAAKAARCRNVFTDLGFAYFGPVDGHDTAAVEDVLRRARTLGRPVVVHAVTVTGQGHPPAEADAADRMHAVSPAAPVRVPARAPGRLSWTAVFSKALLDLLTEHAQMVALTAGMGGPTGLVPFAATYPDRFFDVGIAEQHAVTAAAGMAMGGLHPVVAVYATFLNRAFDQLLVDIALHRLPVTLVLDRAGITGPDGPSHHGMWDPGLLGLVPGMRLAVPRDAAQLRVLLAEAVAHQAGPTVLRFPKATAGSEMVALLCEDGVGVLTAVRSREVLLVAYGPLAEPCVAAATLGAQGIGVTVVDPRWALPVAPHLLALAARHRLVVTVEGSLRDGGTGARLARVCRDAGITTPVHTLGLPRQFLAHGPREHPLDDAALTAPGVTHAVLRARAGRTRQTHPADRSFA